MLIQLVLLTWLQIALAYVDYSEHKLIRAVPTTEEQLRILRSLDENDVIVLRHSRETGRPTDILANATRAAALAKVFEEAGLSTKIAETNFTQELRRERRQFLWNTPTRFTGYEISSKYLSFTDQMRFLEQIAHDYPALARVETIGASYEGRPIRALRIGADGNTKKPIFWIDAGIHSREWISHSAALYFANQLTANSSAYQNLLSRVEFIIAPNVNPDGYEYSRTQDRMWRKTRSVDYARSSCAGVDANRNFPYQWGGTGVDMNPCSEIYPGPKASSEREAQAIISGLTREKDRITGYVALHSYGQDILYPWGYAFRTYPPDVNDLINVGNRMAKAIENVGGRKYRVANSADGLYPAAGAADDFAKHIGVKYAFTLELSPTDDAIGFVLPPNMIQAVQSDVLAALLVLADQLGQEGLSSKNPRRQLKHRSYGRRG